MPSPADPLSPAEESRLKAAARWTGDPFELADTLGLPFSQLLDWLSSPRIAALLQQHDALLARCELNKARQAQSAIAESLTQDFRSAQDPKERRRISAPLLRANTPLRQARPAAARARAGLSPAAAAPSPARATAVPPPAPAGAPIELPPENPPELENLPEPVRDLYHRARRAGDRFNQRPTEATRAEYTRAAEAWHRAQENFSPAGGPAHRAGAPPPTPSAAPP